MASLETLRTKGGVIVTAVIFIALLAFLIGDIFTNGNSLLNSRKMRVGEINGKSISYVDFLNEADYYSNIYKMMWGRDAFSSQEQEMIYNMAWQQFISDNSITPGFEKVGLYVSEAEQIDMINGVYLSPVVTSSFVNPSTGTFDPSLLKQFMTNVSNDNGSMSVWSFLRNQMEQERSMSKYTALVSGGFYANALEVNHGVKAADETFTAKVIGVDYSTIADSLVKISDSQIKKYYKENKKSYKQEAARDVEYVVFDVIPSETDYAEAQEAVNKISAEFAVSEAPMQYATLNSQEKPDMRYLRSDQLAPEVAALAFAGGQTMAGPTLTNDAYTMSRVVGVRMMPDTIGVKQILLQKDQAKLADSIVTALASGADFASLAMKYSKDGSVSQNSGDMGRFTPEQVPTEFADASINATVGQVYRVETPAGLHIATLTYKSKPVQKAQIATVTYKVDPSAATIQSAYQKASSFAANAAGTTEGFRQVVNDETLSKRTVRIRSTERTISGLENSKELVRWAFNGKKGDVSSIIDIDGDYFVAALVDVKEDGFAPLEQVSDQIAQVLRNEEKGRMISEKMSGQTLEQVASAVGAEIKEVPGVQWTAFYMPEFGVEPKLIGAIFAAKPQQLSKPVEGATGIYRFVVTNVEKTGTTNAEEERMRINATAAYYLNERTMQALTEESKVTDLRVKFF